MENSRLQLLNSPPKPRPPTKPPFKKKTSLTAPFAAFASVVEHFLNPFHPCLHLDIHLQNSRQIPQIPRFRLAMTFCIKKTRDRHARCSVGKRPILFGVVTLSVGLMIAAATFVYRVIQMGHTAERQTMSITYLTTATTDYIQTYHDWPQSWEDLAKARAQVGFVAIPRDREWVKKYVFVDFKANLRQIAGQTPSTFTGFGPTGEAYYDYPRWYANVIDAAKEAQTTNKP